MRACEDGKCPVLGGENSSRMVAVDGLRALAIMLVVFYHAEMRLFVGGFVGVDIFYVISGFVITTLIDREWLSGEFSYKAFYLRRLRRLMPALLVMCAVVSGIALWLFSPYALSLFGMSLWSMVLGVENFVLMAQAMDYFSALSQRWPLLHGWSLAIEAQFYLVYPALLLLLLRHVPREGMARVLMLLAVLSFVVSVLVHVFVPMGSVVAFYMLPTRAWELLWGASIAYATITQDTSQVGTHPQWRGWIGLGWLVLVLLLAYRMPAHWMLLKSLGACLATVMLLQTMQDAPRHPVVRLLSSPFMVVVGMMSYSLYLWHWPLLMFSRYVEWDGRLWLPRLVAIQLAFVVAYLSWRYVERPIAGVVQPQLRLRLQQAVCGAVALCVMVGGSVWYQNGVVGAIAPFAERMLASRMTVNALQAQCHAQGQDEDEVSLDGCLAGAPSANQSYSVLVWGDSQANQFVPVIAKLGQEHGFTLRQMTKNGCPPLFVEDDVDNASCHYYNQLVRKAVESNPNLRYVVLTANFRRHLAPYYHYVQAGREIGFAEALRQTVDWLKARGITPIVIAPIPSFQHNTDMELCFEYVTRRGRDDYCLGGDNRVETTQASALLETIAARNVVVIDPESFMCPQGVCAVHDNNVFYYHNASYLSYYGVMRLYPLFEKFWQTMRLESDKGKK